MDGGSRHHPDFVGENRLSAEQDTGRGNSRRETISRHDVVVEGLPRRYLGAGCCLHHVVPQTVQHMGFG